MTNHPLKFIVGWFNHHGKKLAKIEVQGAGLGLLGAITSTLVKKPAKSSIIIAYQREYYDERIRGDFQKEWDRVSAVWNEAVKSGNTQGLEEPVKLKVRTHVAKLAWERESPEFREEFIKSNDEQHTATLDVFERRNEVPVTPQDYAECVFPFLFCPYISQSDLSVLSNTCLV